MLSSLDDYHRPRQEASIGTPRRIEGGRSIKGNKRGEVIREGRREDDEEQA